MLRVTTVKKVTYMKKTYYLIILVFIAALALAACGGSDATIPEQPLPPPEIQFVPEDNSDSIEPPPPIRDEDNTPEETIADEPETPPVFFFKIGDTIVDLNENIKYIIAGAGEPIGVLELPSCAFDGMDRVFRYPGADLYTYPIGDDDFVYNIAFFDSTVRTAEGGIRLGLSLQDVLDAYGDDYELESGMYTFTRGLTVLEFLVDDDTVIGITYRFLVDI